MSALFYICECVCHHRYDRCLSTHYCLRSPRSDWDLLSSLLCCGKSWFPLPICANPEPLYLLTYCTENSKMENLMEPMESLQLQIIIPKCCTEVVMKADRSAGGLYFLWGGLTYWYPSTFFLYAPWWFAWVVFFFFKTAYNEVALIVSHFIHPV